MLNLGSNYVPTPKRLPLLDTVAGIEAGAYKLNEEDAHELRGKICGIMKRAKVPENNLSRLHAT